MCCSGNCEEAVLLQSFLFLKIIVNMETYQQWLNGTLVKVSYTLLKLPFVFVKVQEVVTLLSMSRRKILS